MARSSNKDPLDRFRWSVSVDGFSRLGFTSCEVPKVTFNTVSYPEGGNHLFPKQIVDSATYKPVTLTRGVTSDRSFNAWAKEVISFTNQISDNNTAQRVQYRRTVVIQHLDRIGRAIVTYTLYNAFPIEYSPASDFSSDGDDTLSMEKLVLAYESFEVTTLGQDNNPLGLTDVAKRLINRAF